MMRIFQTLVVFAVGLITLSTEAKQLCAVQNTSIKVSVHSNACQADPCQVKLQEGRKVYFEFHPMACQGDKKEFAIHVKKKNSKAKPRLLSCDGNASCPSRFETNGKTQNFEAQGKTWGTIGY